MYQRSLEESVGEEIKREGKQELKDFDSAVKSAEGKVVGK